MNYLPRIIKTIKFFLNELITLWLNSYKKYLNITNQKRIHLFTIYNIMNNFYINLGLFKTIHLFTGYT